MFIVVNAIGDDFNAFTLMPFDEVLEANDEYKNQIRHHRKYKDEDGTPSDNGSPENGEGIDPTVTIGLFEMKNGNQINIDPETSTIELDPAVVILKLHEGEASDIKIERIS